MKWLACLCQGPPPVEQLFTSSHVYTPVVNSICLDKTAIVAVLRIEKGLQTHQGHGAANALVEASTCIHVSAGCGLAHDLYPKQLAASLAWLDPSCTSKLQALLQVCSTDTSQSSSSERNEVMVAVQWPPAPMQAGLTPVTHVLRMVVACWPPDGLQPQRIELWSPTPGSLRNKERVLVVQHLPCAVSVPPPATPTPQTTPAAVPTVGSDAEGLPLRRVKAPASKGNAPFLPTMWHRRARRASAPNATSQAAAALAMLFAQESHPLSSSGRGRTSATHTLSSRTTDTTHKTPSWAAALHVAEAIPLEKPDQERVATQILTRSRLPSRINSGNGSQPHGLPPQQALDGLAMEALPIIVTIIDFGAPSRQDKPASASVGDGEVEVVPCIQDRVLRQNQLSLEYAGDWCSPVIQEQATTPTSDQASYLAQLFQLDAEEAEVELRQQASHGASAIQACQVNCWLQQDLATAIAAGVPWARVCRVPAAIYPPPCPEAAAAAAVQAQVLGAEGLEDTPGSVALPTEPDTLPAEPGAPLAEPHAPPTGSDAPPTDLELIVPCVDPMLLDTGAEEELGLANGEGVVEQMHVKVNIQAQSVGADSPLTTAQSSGGGRSDLDALPHTSVYPIAPRVVRLRQEREPTSRSEAQLVHSLFEAPTEGFMLGAAPHVPTTSAVSPDGLFAAPAAASRLGVTPSAVSAAEAAYPTVASHCTTPSNTSSRSSRPTYRCGARGNGVVPSRHSGQSATPTPTSQGGGGGRSPWVSRTVGTLHGSSSFLYHSLPGGFTQAPVHGMRRVGSHRHRGSLEKLDPANSADHTECGATPVHGSSSANVLHSHALSGVPAGRAGLLPLLARASHGAMSGGSSTNPTTQRVAALLEAQGQAELSAAIAAAGGGMPDSPIPHSLAAATTSGSGCVMLPATSLPSRLLLAQDSSKGPFFRYSQPQGSKAGSFIHRMPSPDIAVQASRSSSSNAHTLSASQAHGLQNVIEGRAVGNGSLDHLMNPNSMQGLGRCWSPHPTPWSVPEEGVGVTSNLLRHRSQPEPLAHSAHLCPSTFSPAPVELGVTGFAPAPEAVAASTQGEAWSEVVHAALKATAAPGVAVRAAPGEKVPGDSEGLSLSMVGHGQGGGKGGHEAHTVPALQNNSISVNAERALPVEPVHIPLPQEMGIGTPPIPQSKHLTPVPKSEVLDGRFTLNAFGTHELGSTAGFDTSKGMDVVVVEDGSPCHPSGSGCEGEAEELFSLEMVGSHPGLCAGLSPQQALGNTELQASEKLQQQGEQPLQQGEQPLQQGEQPLQQGEQILQQGEQPLQQGEQPLQQGEQHRTPKQQVEAQVQEGAEDGEGEEGMQQIQEVLFSWHEITAVPVWHEALGRNVAILVQVDVTERTEMERRLLQLTQAQLQLLEHIFPRHILEQLARLSAAPPNLPPANQSDTTGPAAAAAAEVQEEDQEKRLQAAGDGSQLSMAALTRMATYSPMITVLFADCVSFTNMCQQVPPAAVMAFLNDLFSRFDAKIGVHGVWKVETAGDAYLVAGGLIGQDEEGFKALAPQGDDEDDDRVQSHARAAISVLRFALDMLASAREVRLPHTGEPAQIRIGIHAGPVVSGLVGLQLPKYSLFGDTMNHAARLESTSRPGCIHVSDSLKSLLETEVPGLPWVATGGVMLKGKGVCQTYLLDPATLATPAPGMAGTEDGQVRIRASSLPTIPGSEDAVPPEAAVSLGGVGSAEDPAPLPPPPPPLVKIEGEGRKSLQLQAALSDGTALSSGLPSVSAKGCTSAGASELTLQCASDTRPSSLAGKLAAALTGNNIAAIAGNSDSSQGTIGGDPRDLYVMVTQFSRELGNEQRAPPPLLAMSLASRPSLPEWLLNSSNPGGPGPKQATGRNQGAGTGAGEEETVVVDLLGPSQATYRAQQQLLQRRRAARARLHAATGANSYTHASMDPNLDPSAASKQGVSAARQLQRRQAQLGRSNTSGLLVASNTLGGAQTPEAAHSDGDGYLLALLASVAGSYASQAGPSLAPGIHVLDTSRPLRTFTGMTGDGIAGGGSAAGSAAVAAPILAAGLHGEGTYKDQLARLPTSNLSAWQRLKAQIQGSRWGPPTQQPGNSNTVLATVMVAATATARTCSLSGALQNPPIASLAGSSGNGAHMGGCVATEGVEEGMGPHPGTASITTSHFWASHRPFRHSHTAADPTVNSGGDALAVAPRQRSLQLLNKLASVLRPQSSTSNTPHTSQASASQQQASQDAPLA